MFEYILFFAVASAGMSLTWHIALEDRPVLKEKLKAFSKLFVCGSCQVFWLTLLCTMVTIHSISMPWRISPVLIESFIAFIVMWQAMALFANAVRYGCLFVIEHAKSQYRKNLSQ